MSEINIEYDKMPPEALIKALHSIAHEEDIEDELIKALNNHGAGSEHDIWSNNGNKNLAKIENWVTSDLLTPLESYRQWLYKQMGFKDIDISDQPWAKYINKPKAINGIEFPKETAGRLAISPVFLGEIENAIGKGYKIDIKKLPTTVDGIIKIPKINIGISTKPIIDITGDIQEAIEWAEKAAGLKIGQWANAIRDDIRWTIAESMSKRLEPWKIQQALWDKFGQYATDLRRVAITETNDAYINGKILSWDEGTFVQGVSAPDACKKCKELIDGKLFVIRHTPPEHPTDEDYKDFMWPGKSNFGRKREDWIPAISNHPFCRCSLIEVPNNTKEKQK